MPCRPSAVVRTVTVWAPALVGVTEIVATPAVKVAVVGTVGAVPFGLAARPVTVMAWLPVTLARVRIVTVNAVPATAVEGAVTVRLFCTVTDLVAVVVVLPATSVTSARSE